MCLFFCPDPPAIVEPAPTRPARGSLADLSHVPWRHVDGKVSAERFERDKAKCATIASMAPVGEGTPQIKYLATFFQCFRAIGYAPVYPKE